MTVQQITDDKAIYTEATERLDSLLQQKALIIERLTDKANDSLDASLKKRIEDSYKQNAYDLNIAIIISMSKIYDMTFNNRIVKSIVEEKANAIKLCDIFAENCAYIKLDDGNILTYDQYMANVSSLAGYDLDKMQYIALSDITFNMDEDYPVKAVSVMMFKFVDTNSITALHIKNLNYERNSNAHGAVKDAVSRIIEYVKN